jgi:uncharacterized protein (DUF2141 family)
MRLFTFILFTSNFLLFGCANQTSPTGGPKDEDAPVLVNSKPKDRQTNINPKEISLEFDELIKLKNAKEQILITPRIDQEYEITSKRNRVILKLEKPLSDSTTYTINFREGVQDLTEGNIPKNLKLAFSTGPYLDSLIISGRVNTLLTNIPAKDYSILLYNLNDTLSILNGPPIYLTKTSDKGEFEFTNLKKGAYKLYALKDKNKNLMVDLKSEPYGFYTNDILLDSTITNLELGTQSLNVTPLKILSARQAGTTFEIKYNKYVSEYKIQNNDSIKLFSNFLDETNQTIQIFNPLIIKDSLEVHVSAIDSIFNHLTDTINIKFEPTKRTPRVLETKVNLNKIFVNDGNFSGTVNFNKPITSINKDSIFIYLDSVNIFHFDSTQIQWNNNQDKLTLDYIINPNLLLSPATSNKTPTTSPKGNHTPATEDAPTNENETNNKPEKSPHLYFGRNAFISTEADSSKAKPTDLSFTKPDLFGIILVEIQTSQSAYTIQLIDSKNNIIQSINNQSKFSFSKVSPGDYRIRILVDSNNNGKWDAGNIMTNTAPEPVIFYKSTDGNEVLTIRANWELGPNIVEF